MDGPIAWREAGEGPVVVLLHGLGGSRTAWEPQLATLSAARRVVAWDLPGYGASAPLAGPLTFDGLADAVAGLLDAVGTQVAHLVGLSFGGMIAQHAVLRHPARVRSLALLATSPAFGLDGTSATTWRGGPARAPGCRPHPGRHRAGGDRCHRGPGPHGDRPGRAGGGHGQDRTGCAPPGHRLPAHPRHPGPPGRSHGADPGADGRARHRDAARATAGPWPRRSRAPGSRWCRGQATCCRPRRRSR